MINKFDQDINVVSLVPGMTDVSSEVSLFKSEAQSRIANILGSNGYDSYEYPILEPTELFVRKSGGEITSRIFSFVDPGGNRVSLRPEFTSSVIRAYVSSGLEDCKVLRSQYVGPVFRYADPTSQSPLRQFTQQGCEIIGSVTGRLNGDFEILNLAIKAVDAIVSGKLTVKLGNVGFIKNILSSFGLNEVLIYFTLSHLTDIKASASSINEICHKAKDMGLVVSSGGNILSNQNYDTQLTGEALSQAIGVDTGRRTKEEIIERLDRKKSQIIEMNVYKNALDELASFLRVFDGRLSEIAIDSTFSDEFSKSMRYFSDLTHGLDKTKNVSVDYIIDFASKRGVTYYTGLIFDLDMSTDKDGYSIGGGGRYDGLVKSLGGESDVPAIGFALNIDTLLQTSRDTL